MKHTHFSLIVTCYNVEKYVGDCLKLIYHQAYSPEFFEVFCIDDGSTDRTLQIIQSYKTKLKNLTIVSTENEGLEKACNRGVRMAHFERIMRVDADDLLDVNILSAMDNAIRLLPNHDFYYCQKYWEYCSEDKQRFCQLPEFNVEEIFSRGDFFATGTVYKKIDLVEIGLFPEDVKNCGLENYAVVLALLRKKKIGKPVSDASFKYRRHQTNMSLLKRHQIIDYGKKLLASFGRSFQTNEFHPYQLKLSD